VLLTVDARTSFDIFFVLVLLIALAASLPLSALTLRKPSTRGHRNSRSHALDQEARPLQRENSIVKRM
jgi:hypothetical protein